MAVQIPFPLPSTGFAMNSKVRVNLDFLVDQFNQFNTGTATWDKVAIGTANSLTGTLTFYNASNANYLTFQPGVTAASTAFTLPTGVPSASHKFLTSTTGGVMSWSLLSETTSYTGNQLLYIDASNVIQELAVGTGNKVLVNSSPPSFFTLSGTANQIVITPTAGFFTFSTPQDIGTASSVQFSRVKVDAGTYASPGFYFASSTANTVGLFAESNGTGLNIRAGGSGGSTVFSVDSTGFAVSTLELRSPTVRATTAFKLSTSTGSIVTIQALTTSFGDYTLTLPPNDGTVSGQTLTTDGSGVLTWAIPAGTGANTALSNLASVAVNTHLLPGSADAVNLGSNSLPYLNLYTGLIQVGRSGFAGTIALYPTTTNKGSTTVTMSDCSGSTITNVNFAAQAGARTYTVPDAGASASFVMTEGAATLNGTKTFGSAPVFSALTASTVPYLDSGRALTSSAVTPTELGYVSGVTSAIQTQLGTKAPTASPTFTGTVTLPNPITAATGLAITSATSSMLTNANVKVTIGNNAVADLSSYVKATGIFTIIVMAQSDTSVSGLAQGRNASTPTSVKIGGGANFDVSTATLTGTTGTNGHVTLSSTATQVLLENRIGESRDFFLMFVSGS